MNCSGASQGGSADAALRLLVLEGARHAGAPADAAVGADHVRHRRAGLHRREHVRAGDEVGDLVAAPRVSLDADPLRIDVALRDDRVDGRDDALLGALARIARLVDDVGHQHDVAVADVARDVDARAGIGRAVAVQSLGQLLVDVDHQRILLRRIEVLRLGDDRAQRLPVRVDVLHQLGLAPDVFALLRIGVRHLLHVAEARVADPEIRELVEPRLREDHAIGVARLDQRRRTTCRPSRSSRARRCRRRPTR